MDPPEVVVQGRPSSPSGLYSPITQGRQVNIPGGLDVMVGRLVSYHEAMHQYLNSSTSFGGAMVLVGSILEAGEQRFDTLLTKMVDAARETHETYATVTSVCTASGGSMDRELLRLFPDYRRFQASFHQVFGKAPRPFLASVALTSCARAAMQTDICTRLFADAPEEWHRFAIPARDAPDARFGVLHRADVAAKAMQAIDGVLAEFGDVGRSLLRGVPPSDEHTLVTGLDVSQQDRLNSVSFEVYADALEAAGYLRPQYDAQRPAAGYAVQRVREAFGDRLRTLHVVADGLDDDMEAVFLDFRRETLVFRDNPDPAVIIGCDGSELASPANFVLVADGLRYVQLVSMPVAKLRALYRFGHGGELLDAMHAGVATVLRRRWVYPDGRSRVEMLLVGRDDLTRFTAVNEDVLVIPLISAAATGDAAWRREWLTPGDGPIDRIVVVLDVDPFKFLERREITGELSWTRIGLRMQAGAAEVMEIFCVTVPDQPGVLYLTPCTIPFRQAVVEYLSRRKLVGAMSGTAPPGWDEILPRVLGHLVREESRFGFEFWS